MTTIFDNIVRTENDYTNLLCGLLQRHPKLAAAIVSQLVGHDIALDKAATFSFRTQQSFLSPDGRSIPDLVIQGATFWCLVEVKIDPQLGLTDRQMEGYQACFPKEGERYLAFVVPEDWHCMSQAESIQSSPALQGIQVRVIDWPTLIGPLSELLRHLDDRVLGEAINFMKWAFEIEPMTNSERESITPWSSERYSAIRKLEKTVDRTKKLFDARGFKSELETSDIQSYGFYVVRDRSYLVWVGIWTKSPSALSFGYHSTNSGWIRPTIPPNGWIEEEYHLRALEASCLEDPELIYAKVRAFLDSVDIT